MDDILLDVRNLTKYFPINNGWFSRKKEKVYALDGVSFSLRHGQTLGLVGESGCGKSTLGKTILRLHPVTSGQVFFDKKDITKSSMRSMRPLRREMQIIFQDPFSSLNPKMTVNSILREPFRIHNIDSGKNLEKRVGELLEVVGLPSEAGEKYPHEFSGGQRQRIGIARAIALEPKLIVADEPVSALDVSIQSQILNLMGDLRKRYNLSYLFIAHDLAVVEHISDIVAVMYLGKIVEFARGEDLYDNPSHPYTKALISAIPKPEFHKIKKFKETLKGDVPSPIAPPTGCHFHPRCPRATEICSKKSPDAINIGKKHSHLVACHHI